jgi:hypothetical protein
MIKIWDQLIIDEISFSTEDQMGKLNTCLYHVWRKQSDCFDVISLNMIFGGYSIIFCGNFWQLPPMKVKENQLLYANSGSRENSINCYNSSEQ